jgi:hypothetical protein
MLWWAEPKESIPNPISEQTQKKQHRLGIRQRSLIWNSR